MRGQGRDKNSEYVPIERELEELYYVHKVGPLPQAVLDRTHSLLGTTPVRVFGHWLLDCEIDAVYEEGLTLCPSRVVPRTIESGTRTLEPRGIESILISFSISYDFMVG